TLQQTYPGALTRRAVLPPPARPYLSGGRITISGRSFRLGHVQWYVKGLTYGPFGPDTQGCHLPLPAQRRRDLRQIAELGGTALRLYHVPPRQFLDDAAECDLRVLIDLPWEKHRCFLEDWSSQNDAILRARRTAKELGDHPAL